MSSKVAANDDHLQEPPSLMTSLPEEILLDCVARVPRSYYPILSIVSKQFRSLVTSPELYMTRSRLGYDEHCLYVAISENQTSNIHWYTLGRKPNNKLWLVPIPSLPPMPLHGSYVVAGSSIYVMGGFHHWGLITPSVSRIDCVSHSVEPLTRMPTAVAGSVSELVDGKIYVIGGSNTRSPELKSSSKRIMVFDTVAKTWEVRKRLDWEVGQRWLSSVEMAGKIYMRSYRTSYVYEAKEGICETDQILHSKEWSNSCVIDDVLYYYDDRKNCLRAYDQKERVWGVVKGVGLGLCQDGSWSCTTSYGNKLAVFLHKVEALSETTEIWCAEIALERREGGEMLGKVESFDLVLVGKSCIMKCLGVRI
ncbi:unnamed protein product [Arabidopsis halleri]